jgi:hypothetical protein
MCPWYTAGGKMSDKNMEQRINVKFYVKIGTAASDPAVLLTLAVGGYAMINSSII